MKSHAKVKGLGNADITNQFEFFENYNPDEHKGKDFGMTPPTEASVKQQLNSVNATGISSRQPGYLDADLEHAKQAARTRDIKNLFEKWNYDNNVYIDSTDYNDSTPEFEEIDDSQTETTKTLVYRQSNFGHESNGMQKILIFRIRAKFENLPHSNRMQSTHHPKVNRFVVNSN